MWRIDAERVRSRIYLSSLAISSTVQQALHLTTDGRIYVQNVGEFEPAQLYAVPPPNGGTQDFLDAPLRERLTLFYSREQELRWDQHDTASLTAMHLQHFTSVPTATWQQLNSTPGPHLLVLYHSGWDWTDQALAELRASSGLQVTPVGPALGGDAVLVR